MLSAREVLGDDAHVAGSCDAAANTLDNDTGPGSMHGSALSAIEVLDTKSSTDIIDDECVDEAALVSKITWRLIPFIAWLYMLSFLDRVNLANVHGTLLVDLHLNETDYSYAVSIFFLGYCTFEIPSNLVMQRVQPRIWIARILVRVQSGAHSLSLSLSVTHIHTISFCNTFTLASKITDHVGRHHVRAGGGQ